MTASEPLEAQVATSLANIAEHEWDALVGDDDPFVEYAFLRALEVSESVGPGTGWQPVHVTLTGGGRLVGALPLYVKDHSFGEYIFDWAWADASRRLGAPYYPKLVSMVPVTPATGTRFLVHPDENYEEIVQGLLRAAQTLLEDMDGSSLHLLFLNEREKRVACEARGPLRLSPRLGFQYHFSNDSYESFEHFLATCRSSLRKQMKRERRQVAESGLKIVVKEGDEVTEQEWTRLGEFYRDTCARRGSAPYLSEAFFSDCSSLLSRRAVCVLAYQGSDVVAGTLNFEKGQRLYGRYWGALDDHDFLHFELCYYRLIERLIDKGMSLLEAGAQGSHKLRRGFMPRPVHSAHLIRHPALARAVDDFLPREAFAVEQEMKLQAEHGPFKRCSSAER